MLDVTDAICAELTTLADEWEHEAHLARLARARRIPLADHYRQAAEMLRGHLRLVRDRFRLISVAEYAKVHGTTRQNIYLRIQAGTVPAVVAGNGYLLIAPEQNAAAHPILEATEEVP